MAHFAKLDENDVVLEVVVVQDNELIDDNGIKQEQKGIDFLVAWSGGYPYWKQTIFDGSIRKNFAGLGYTYDVARDAFIPQKPSADATLDEATCQWIVPASLSADSV